MALKKCPECSAEISTKAAKCPQCGAPQKKPTSLITWLALALVVAVIAANGLSGEKGGKTSQQAAAPKKQETAEEKKRREIDDMRFRKTVVAAASLKKSLRDPDSLQWEAILADENADTICLEYRARNGFGGMSREQVVFSMGSPSQAAADWNRFCAGKTLFDMKFVRNAL